jgi:hypothetical protein
MGPPVRPQVWQEEGGPKKLIEGKWFRSFSVFFVTSLGCLPAHRTRTSLAPSSRLHRPLIVACPSFSFCLSRFRLCRSHHPRSRTVRRPPQSGHPFPYLYPRPILERGDGGSGGRRDQEETAMARAGAVVHRYRSDAPPFPSTSGLASTSAPSFPLLAQMATQHGEGGPFVGAGEGRQRRWDIQWNAHPIWVWSSQSGLISAGDSAPWVRRGHVIPRSLTPPWVFLLQFHESSWLPATCYLMPCSCLMKCLNRSPS